MLCMKGKQLRFYVVWVNDVVATSTATAVAAAPTSQRMSSATAYVCACTVQMMYTGRNF